MLSGNTEVTGHCPDGRACPFVREVLARVGDNWSVLVVVVLGVDGTKRFSDLKRDIRGISQRMLTLTLRGLERDGLVKRQVFATVPPRVDYLLTPLGETLVTVLKPLGDWALENRTEIESARVTFDNRKGAEMMPVEG